MGGVITKFLDTVVLLQLLLGSVDSNSRDAVVVTAWTTRVDTATTAWTVTVNRKRLF